MNKTFFVRLVAALLILLFLRAVRVPLGGCQPGGPDGGDGGDVKQLSLAVNSGVEGDALKAAARDYEALRGVKINIAEFPYANLFEKELVDLVNRTGAYDLIMLDDPWFPRFASGQGLLTELGPLYEARGLAGPEEDFVKTSLAL